MAMSHDKKAISLRST